MQYKKVVISDLDGTLLDKYYSFDSARPALDILKDQKIPLIICTSKTRAEIEVFKDKLGNKNGFISENGGAIFVPKKHFPWLSKKTLKNIQKKLNLNLRLKIKGKYKVIELGTPYETLVGILKKISKGQGISIRGFSDMSLKELVKDSGLSLEQARLAKKREYDEAFILDDKRCEKKLFREIKKKGLNYTKGGKYYHILGKNDKGKAVKILTELYNKRLGPISTISLGNAKNDYPMFKATDKFFLLKEGPSEWNRKIIFLLGMDKKEIKRAEKLYQSSVKILKKLQMSNGAILASFPKSRYPYVYPRDHAICLIALIEVGMIRRAKKSLEFILNSQNKDGSFPQRVDKFGKDKSYKPIQLDNTALVLYAFAKYIQITNDNKFLKTHKKQIKKSIKYISARLNKKNYLFFTPNSVHEFPPLEEGLEVWANAGCYAALKKLEEIEIKSHINLKKLKNSINHYFWNGNYFIKNIRLNESSSVVLDIDASAYALADFGVFEDGSEKIKKTVKVIEKELWHKKLGGICRYKKSIGRNNGGWGPWPHFTLMICRHFIKQGKKRQADKYLTWVLNIAYKGKLPEHISTKKDFEEWVKNYKRAGILRKDREIMIKNIRKNKMFKRGLAYSVLPLAWPHAEFIRTWHLYKKRFL